MPFPIGGIEGLHLAFIQACGHHALNHRNAQALLKGADDDQIGDMHPIIALFTRLRHNMRANIIINRS